MISSGLSVETSTPDASSSYAATIAVTLSGVRPDTSAPFVISAYFSTSAIMPDGVSEAVSAPSFISVYLEMNASTCGCTRWVFSSSLSSAMMASVVIAPGSSAKVSQRSCAPVMSRSVAMVSTSSGSASPNISVRPGSSSSRLLRNVWIDAIWSSAVVKSISGNMA